MNMMDIVRFVFEEVRGSMDEPWDAEMMSAVVRIFESGYKTEPITDGFRIVPEDSKNFAVEIKEYRDTIFVSAQVNDGFPVRYSKMAFDQKKAKAIFYQALDILTA